MKAEKPLKEIAALLQKAQGIATSPGLIDLRVDQLNKLSETLKLAQDRLQTLFYISGFDQGVAEGRSADEDSMDSQDDPNTQSEATDEAAVPDSEPLEDLSDFDQGLMVLDEQLKTGHCKPELLDFLKSRKWVRADRDGLTPRLDFRKLRYYEVLTLADFSTRYESYRYRV